jgi:hypothetical protein
LDVLLRRRHGSAAGAAAAAAAGATASTATVLGEGLQLNKAGEAAVGALGIPADSSGVGELMELATMKLLQSRQLDHAYGQFLLATQLYASAHRGEAAGPLLWNQAVTLCTAVAVQLRRARVTAPSQLGSKSCSEVDGGLVAPKLAPNGPQQNLAALCDARCVRMRFPPSSSSFPFEHVPYLLPLLRCVGARACRLDAALTLLKAAVHAPPLDHGSSGPSGESLRKNGPFLSGFPMFVPSLSWQNHHFYIYMAQKDRFFLPINQPTCSFRLLCVSHYR